MSKRKKKPIVHKDLTPQELIDRMIANSASGAMWETVQVNRGTLVLLEDLRKHPSFRKKVIAEHKKLYK